MKTDAWIGTMILVVMCCAGFLLGRFTAPREQALWSQAADAEHDAREFLYDNGAEWELRDCRARADGHFTCRAYSATEHRSAFARCRARRTDEPARVDKRRCAWGP